MKKFFAGVVYFFAVLWAEGLLLLGAFRWYNGDFASAGGHGWLPGGFEITRNAVSTGTFFLAAGMFLFGLIVMKCGKKRIVPVVFGMLTSVLYLIMSITSCFKLTRYIGEGVFETLANPIVRMLHDIIGFDLGKAFRLISKLDGILWDMGGFIAALFALLYGVICLTGRSGKVKKVKKPEFDEFDDEDFETEAPCVHEQMPVREAESVREADPVMEEAPVAEEAPFVEEEPAVEDAPVIEEEPAVEDAPVIEEVPAIEETPVQKEMVWVCSVPSERDPKALDRLKKLAELYKMGILTEEEFIEKKRELLRKI